MTLTHTEPTTRTLDVPGATLTYDVRLNPGSSEPPLFLIGSPMAAAGFTTLASHFPDRTVVTYDPRGSERSTKLDATGPSTPEEHADDLHRLIQAVGLGPVDLFATSGGAVNAMALVRAHPHDVRTLVAHEPPIIDVLPDREAAKAASRQVHADYQRYGFGVGMARFITLVMHEGPLPDDWASQPAPDPAMFGLPTEDDGSRDDPLLGQNMESSPEYVPDFDALRSGPTRIVMAAGEESLRTLTGRSTVAIAERLGLEPTVFPGNHAGFLGGEYGQTGKPDEFASTLRAVLEGEG
ncbi:MAG TPA: alpha/beta hydrolase [Candidatus Limnocylindria bacterium]|nr:alpha/beta hydrolase [Candidatus Limnocylindria bacterium]